MMEGSETMLNSPASSSTDTLRERDKFIDEFWSTYEESGIELAAKFFRREVQGNMAVTQLLVPHLVEAGYARDINMLKAVEEMQLIDLEEDPNADGTADDGSIVHSDSADETVDHEDEAESTDAGDADREDEAK